MPSASGRCARRSARAPHRVLQDRVGALVDVVVAVDDQVHLVLLEQRHPGVAHPAVGGVRVGRGEGAVVEEDHDEVDVVPGRAAPPGAGRASAVCLPPVLPRLAGISYETSLASSAITPDVAVGEGVRRRAGRPGPGRCPAGSSGRSGRRSRRASTRPPCRGCRWSPSTARSWTPLGLGQELVPGAGVVGVGGLPGAGRVGVADVARVQVEGRVLAQDQLVVGRARGS